MVLNVHRTIRLIRDGKMGGGGREFIYLSLHYHHQNDSCIKMGSDESLRVCTFHDFELLRYV